MDTDCLYLVVAEKELKDCISPEMEAEWEQLRSGQKVEPIVSLLMPFEVFSVESALTSTINMTSENLVFSKRSSGVLNCCVFELRLTVATKQPLTG